MNRITATTNWNSRRSSSGGDVLQRTDAIESLRLHAVHQSKTSTNSEDITLPISALPVQETGLWMASASFIERGNAHGEKSHEHN